VSRKILIVDDDPAVCATMEYILGRAGNEVRTSLSASEAFALAQQDQFDLLISDLVMPQEDGIDLIRKFKTVFPRMPIVAMSGGARLGTPDTLNSAQAAGADALLGKPFSPDSLRTTVEVVLARQIRPPRRDV
jgi:CheY-like chemotaxis protein